MWRVAAAACLWAIVFASGRLFADSVMEDVSGIDNSYAEIEAGIWYAKWFPDVFSGTMNDGPAVKNNVSMAVLPDISTSIVLGGRSSLIVNYVSDRLYRTWANEMGIDDYKKKKMAVDLVSGLLEQMVIGDPDEAGIAVNARYTYGTFTGTITTPNGSDFGYYENSSGTHPNENGGWRSEMHIADLSCGLRKTDEDEYAGWSRGFYGIGIRASRYAQPAVIGVYPAGESAATAQYFMTDVTIRSWLIGARLQHAQRMTDSVSMDAAAYYAWGMSRIESPVFSVSAPIQSMDLMLRLMVRIAGNDEDGGTQFYFGVRYLLNGNISVGKSFEAKRAQTLYDNNGAVSGSLTGRAKLQFSPVDIFIGPVFGLNIRF